MRKHSSFGETTADGYVELFYIRWNGSGVIRNALLARLNLTPRDIKYDQESRLKAICETDRIGKEQGSGHIPWFTFECIDEQTGELIEEQDEAPRESGARADAPRHTSVPTQPVAPPRGPGFENEARGQICPRCNVRIPHYIVRELHDKGVRCPECHWPKLRSLPNTCSHSELRVIVNGEHEGKLECLAPDCEARFRLDGAPPSGHPRSWQRRCRIVRGPSSIACTPHAETPALVPVNPYKDGAFLTAWFLKSNRLRPNNKFRLWWVLPDNEAAKGPYGQREFCTDCYNCGECEDEE